jgi:Flp pilus assembly protein TadB
MFSMGDTTFPARYTTTKGMLDTTVTNLFQQYKAGQTASASLTNQSSVLKAELDSLNTKLTNIKKTGDTYDREFIDRSAGKNNMGFFRRRGITTLQDWLLFFFFLSYAIICIIVIVYSTAMSTQKALTFGMTFFLSLVVGVMMSAVVMRFI